VNADIFNILRSPFEGKEVGKLPKVTCPRCRDSKTKNCDEHPKRKCGECTNFLTTAHIHIDYVGHAEITDRLLAADRTWSWEPVAWDENGLPRVDANNGMWIRLTVAGVTRLGYGHADGKRGGDAIKETIGDALRNAAMRFGVALDLWGATYDPPQVETGESEAPDGPILATQHEAINGLWTDLGYGGDEQKATRMNIAAKLLGLPELHTFTALTQVQASSLIGLLRAKLEEKGGQA
jgi:hypothetical protein